MDIQIKVAHPELMESLSESDDKLANFQCTIVASGIKDSDDFKRLREVIDNTETFFKPELRKEPD